MTSLNEFAAGAAGPYLAILFMVIATFLCRTGGVLLMSKLNISPALERALRALPGSIVMATILPMTISSGIPAITGVFTAVFMMWWTRLEIMALIGGLAAISLLRFLFPI